LRPRRTHVRDQGGRPGPPVGATSVVPGPTGPSLASVVGVTRFHADRPLGLAPGSIGDYRELARRRLPRQLFDYIDGGAFAEVTLAANVDDLATLRLRQRVLRDVSALTLGTTVLGQELALPVVLGPVGLAGMFATRAEVQAARAAERAGVVFCESTVSICGVEEVAAACAAPVWFQLYVMRDRSYAEGLMARAAAVGCPVLVLTVDLAVVGSRYRDTRNGMSGRPSALGRARRGLDLALHPGWARDVGVRGRPHTFGNLEQAVPGASSPTGFASWVDSQFDPSVTWDDLDWVRRNWPGKLVLKGILDPEDARRAADAGVDGIVVSNHGGRQLDATPSTIRALGPVVDAVGGTLEVLVDGGIRSGLDVAKALAVGARACMIGRAWAWPVAAAGERGVVHALAVMRHELTVALSLLGVSDVADLDRSVLVDPPG
jgi:L-lactate dehydrogenase (cytochrome)